MLGVFHAYDPFVAAQYAQLVRTASSNSDSKAYSNERFGLQVEFDPKLEFDKNGITKPKKHFFMDLCSGKKKTKSYTMKLVIMNDRPRSCEIRSDTEERYPESGLALFDISRQRFRYHHGGDKWHFVTWRLTAESLNELVRLKELFVDPESRMASIDPDF
ncbi:unnamed protein product [Albugo candida]|uniref:Uncharacterized protein n=1 Tax=Albugo candida TaxID=65357 RepID=A0A024FY75_9STRA|nr:unnamed protein product [Albugo candida]|eukprot:CCI11614.1 unnamed protein product [Albugo candida]